MSGRMGELSATISNSHQRNAGSASSLTAGYSSSLALSRNGLFWGGGQDGEPASGMAVNVESEGDEGSSGKVVSVRGSSQSFSLGFGQQSLLLMEGYNATEVTIEDAGVSSQGMAGVKAGGKQALLPDTRASAGSQHQRQYEPTVRWPRTGQGWQTAAGRTATELSIFVVGTFRAI